MKRILLAGASVLALSAAQPVFAADAPVYRKGPAPAAVAVGDQWYVSLFGGWSAANKYNFDFVSIGTGARFAYEVSLQNGYVFGGAIGREINRNFRLELELAHSSFNFGDDYVGTTTGFVGLGESGSLRVTTLMGNVWLGQNMGFVTPYIGGGLGVGWSNGALTITNGVGAQFSGNAAAALAVQLGAGFRLPIAANFEFDLGYRLRHIATTVPPSSIAGFRTEGGRLTTHSIQGGVIVKF